MNLKFLAGIILSGICGILISCQPDPPEPEAESGFPGFVQPAHFPPAVYHFGTNPVTEAGFKLGKKLFYDPILSIDNTVSCGSCHLPSNAFAQLGHNVSHGVEDRLGRRNSPALQHLAWMTSFFHDGGVVDLDLQPIQPITAHDEMAQDITVLPEKLAAIPEYKNLFREAFGTEEITNTFLLKALSQFMVMCVSSNSKYDSVVTGIASYSAIEEKGYTIFKSKCESCHREPLFTDFSFRNNGLPATSIDDQGRFEITSHEEDKYKFKVPSLRNLQYTSPYMHDGRMTSLEEVLDHYSAHIPDTYGTLDESLKKADGIPAITLTDEEKTALLGFLKTLNDRQFVLNPLLAE
ncbi:MAG: cytochrome-c peroxidase [Taibaiella sp.]|nr:cytochrome-c peroxidase [Taibaiella sp.]